jgi:hypothetical protein
VPFFLKRPEPRALHGTGSHQPPRRSPAGDGARPIVGRTVDGLRGIDQRTWDTLVPPGDAALRYAYLSAWERVSLPGLRSSPVLAYDADGGAPIAACPGYWYDLDLLGARFPAAGGALSAARRLRPRLFMARTYELGSPTPLTNPFLVPDEVARPVAVRAMAEAALEEADRKGAQFLLVQNLTSLDGPAASHLAPLGFAGLAILPTVVVTLAFSSFEDYLASMRSQYRRRAHQPSWRPSSPPCGG